MNLDAVKNALNEPRSASFDLYERRPGDYQLIVPICHEDGDMLEIYLNESPKGSEYVRICDFGLSLMRLSYTYDINSDTRKRIFDSILFNNKVSYDEGNMYIDAPLNMLYESILQFAGCVQKVCNMRYWSREIIRSEFHDNLNEFVFSELANYLPAASVSPGLDSLPDIDWSLSHKNQNFHIFGVNGNSKAKDVALLLLEMLKAEHNFISLVVHEDIQNLGRKESLYLTRNADRQYPYLDAFKESAERDIRRLVGSDMK